MTKVDLLDLLFIDLIFSFSWQRISLKHLTSWIKDLKWATFEKNFLDMS